MAAIIASILKDTGLSVVSVFCYLKILDAKKMSPIKSALTGIFVLILSFISYEMKTASIYLTLILAVVCLSVFFKFILKERWGLTITVAFLAYAMSYALLAIAGIIGSFLLGLLFGVAKDSNALVLLPSVFIMQLILAFLLFKIRRLKNGFPFLRKEGFTNFAILFSFFILLFVAVSNKDIDIRQLVLLSVLGAVICGMGMYSWWRSSITRAYKDTLKDKKIYEASKTAISQEREIETLRERNQFLASVIHKDNRLIPAMSLAVQNFIRLSGNQLDKETEEKSQTIIDELTAQTNERAGILSEYRVETDTIPKTNVFKLDAMFEYLRGKAIQYETIFDLAVLCDVKFLVNEVVAETDLVTITADLIDNAIYSVSSNPFKKILTTLCVEGGCYEVRISDSGADFGIDTLRHLGISNATTHEDDGGNGIGYMTIFKILNEVKASLIIREYEHKPNALTKQITVRFDGKNQYAVDSPRVSQSEIDNYRETAIRENGDKPTGEAK